ncbi:hypothetical protein EVAR_83055_1 [Eumeta japonica]|uniref:Uncharacterized protein n=1 Tax=Eumeta variegata TaxID=151549 RepID=A0A4C1VLE9_EUMVA|nr:hypothetical protein EVAR_83055_1 [Eumeta japonica]
MRSRASKSTFVSAGLWKPYHRNCRKSEETCIERRSSEGQIEQQLKKEREIGVLCLNDKDSVNTAQIAGLSERCEPSGLSRLSGHVCLGCRV